MRIASQNPMAAGLESRFGPRSAHRFFSGSAQYAAQKTREMLKITAGLLENCYGVRKTPNPTTGLCCLSDFPLAARTPPEFNFIKSPRPVASIPGIFPACPQSFRPTLSHRATRTE